MAFTSFSDFYISHRTRKGNFLNQIDQLIDWKPTGQEIRRHYAPVSDAVGWPAYPGLFLFKMLLVGLWHGGLSGFEKPFDKGVTFNGSVELPSNFFEQTGKHVFSAAYSTQNGIDFTDLPQLLLPTAPPPDTKHNRWYLSYAFEQSLWRDKANPTKAWGLFGQAAVSDGNPNPVEWSVMGGIGGTSPIPGRERDKFGLGLFYVGYSSQLKDSLRLLLPVRDGGLNRSRGRGAPFG